MEVLFCKENLQAKGDEALEQLSQESGVALQIQVVKCIIACSECATQFIARVNGELIVAETANELVTEVLSLAANANG